MPRLPAPTPALLPRPAASGACWGSTPTTATRSGYDFDQYPNSTVPLDRRAGQLPRASPRPHARPRNTRPKPISCSLSARSRPWKRACKAIWRRNRLGGRRRRAVHGPEPAILPALPGRATDFSYDQDVQAAYATYSFGLGKKLKLSLGGRVERTSLSGRFPHHRHRLRPQLPHAAAQRQRPVCFQRGQQPAPGLQPPHHPALHLLPQPLP